ncbi:hypothetical protein C9374_010031 [Naegleria lovaniensis]|uniref:START domain-containing protein n=1 Tax=Naegleria lovaniensis TaxID=51637 RepID=A0AA88GG88_NAELO|nr:uncharacterized protein C9374_010031 [Naegleria lovaniensis]KAG2375027.1 hypothetical protein C9374_010031 [Naegleria lovaniensis]
MTEQDPSSTSSLNNPSIRSALKSRWKQAHDLGLKMTSQETLSDGTFKFYHTRNNINVFYKPTEETSIVRGEVICQDVKADEFLKTFLTNDMKVKVQLDPHVLRSEIVEKWQDEEGSWNVAYFARSTAPMIAPRDFISIFNIVKIPQDQETIYTSAGIPQDFSSYQLPSHFKPLEGAVRGFNVFTTLRLKELSNGDLKMSYANQALPNGWIPFSIVNAVIFSVPQALGETAKYLRKKLRHLNEGSHASEK